MAEGKQSTARPQPRAFKGLGRCVRRDLLQQIELDVQKKWEEKKAWRFLLGLLSLGEVFECDAPDSGSEKFMCTFPYPYMWLGRRSSWPRDEEWAAAHRPRLFAHEGDLRSPLQPLVGEEGACVEAMLGMAPGAIPLRLSLYRHADPGGQGVGILVLWGTEAAANKLSREPWAQGDGLWVTPRFETFGSPYPTFPPGRPQPKAPPTWQQAASSGAQETAEGVIEVDDEGVTMQWKAPPSTGTKAVKEYIAYMKASPAC